MGYTVKRLGTSALRYQLNLIVFPYTCKGSYPSGPTLDHNVVNTDTLQQRVELCQLLVYFIHSFNRY